MSVDAVAIFNRPKAYPSSEDLVVLLNETELAFQGRDMGWFLSDDRDYIDGPQSITIGQRALGLTSLEKWFRFCNDADASQAKVLNLCYKFASIFKSKSFLIVPDSSFVESRCLDLLDTPSTIEDIEHFLTDLGSMRKTPGDIIYTENSCWHSQGYLYYLAK